MSDDAARPLRSTCGLVVCGLGAAAALLLLVPRLARTLPRDAATARSTGIEEWVELAVLAAGGAAALWLLAGVVVAVACVAVARGSNAHRTVDAALGRWAPSLVRRLARGAVGVGVGAGLVLTPVAATAAEPPAPDTTPAVLDLGWQSTDGSVVPGTPEPPQEPDEAVAAPETAETVADVRPAARDEPADDTHVVVRGDTLWDIAARGLSDDATAADVADEVARWHDANRAVVGDDPGLILPGQVLQAP